MVHEAVVEETRRLYTDLAAHSKFTKDGESIKNSRSLIEEDLYDKEPVDDVMSKPEDSGANLAVMATDMIFSGLVEIG